MVCGTTTCRMARNPSRVAVKRREVGGLQGEAFSALDLSEIGCVESHPTRISGRSSVDPAPRRRHCRHFQGQNRHFQGRRRRNIHTDQIRKSLGGFSKISRHANRNKITVRPILPDSELPRPARQIRAAYLHCGWGKRVTLLTVIFSGTSVARDSGKPTQSFACEFHGRTFETSSI